MFANLFRNRTQTNKKQLSSEEQRSSEEQQSSEEQLSPKDEYIDDLNNNIIKHLKRFDHTEDQKVTRLQKKLTDVFNNNKNNDKMRISKELLSNNNNINKRYKCLAAAFSADEDKLFTLTNLDQDNKKLTFMVTQDSNSDEPPEEFLVLELINLNQVNSAKHYEYYKKIFKIAQLYIFEEISDTTGGKRRRPRKSRKTRRHRKRNRKSHKRRS